MTLSLETVGIIPERSPGVAAVMTRELTAQDLEDAKHLPKVHTEQSPLKRLSERHKNVARLLADDRKISEVSVITGMSESAIVHLVRDPAFKNLMQFYKDGMEKDFQPYHEKLAELGMVIIDMIRDRLEDNPDEHTFGQLMELMKMTADRTGHGPQSTSNLNVNVNLAERLQAARKRHEAAKLIEGEVVKENTA